MSDAPLVSLDVTAPSFNGGVDSLYTLIEGSARDRERGEQGETEAETDRATAGRAVSGSPSLEK